MKRNEFLKLKPMLLEEISKPFNDDNYLYEIKFDGVRALIFINQDEIIIKSRRNTILNDTFPELLNIKNITKETCVFDGEIILMDNNKPSFSKLQERIKLKNKNQIKYMKDNYPVTFVCFDILYKNKDLTKLPLIKRKEILNNLEDTIYFNKSRYFLSKGIQLFEFIKKENLEGIVAKKKYGTYTYNIRSNNWLKIKNQKLESFYICGYINDPKLNIITIILGEKYNNEYYFVGKVILGKQKDLAKQIINTQVVNSNYLLNNKETNVIYIKPIHKVEVYYQERTKNNLLRHAHIKN